MSAYHHPVDKFVQISLAVLGALVIMDIYWTAMEHLV